VGGAAGSNERAAPMGHWRAVFDKVTAAPLQHDCSCMLSLLPKTCLLPGKQHACQGVATPIATKASSLGAQARAFLGRREAGADRAELQRTLQELHADVFTQIDQEVCLLLPSIAA
jgi:hypothetical protein